MTAKFRVERLTPARRDDFLRFFDHERGPAFADNPDWAKCYCHFYHVPKVIDWASLDGNANRTAMTARIEAAEMDGFLAYAAGDVVGWLNAQPRIKLPHCMARMGIAAPPLDVPPQFAAAMVCFVIAPAWRRRGVARALVDGAVESFAARGILVVDAFPFKAGASTIATDHYHGPLSLFREAGFDVLAEHKNMTVMRKRLGAKH
ncbi:MAG: GNAT family N-acetyltransferase [Casimicrobiaceae bacterium]